MFNISKYLDKTVKKLSKESETKEKIIKSVLVCSGLQITPEAIEIKEETVYIKSNQAVKNKIFINKKEIIDSLKQLGENFLEIK